MLAFDEIKSFLIMTYSFAISAFIAWGLFFADNNLDSTVTLIMLIGLAIATFFAGIGYLIKFVMKATTAKNLKEERARETTPEAQEANLRENIIFDIIRLENPNLDLIPSGQFSKNELKYLDIDPRLLGMDISDLKNLRERLRSEVPSKLQKNITVAYSIGKKLSIVVAIVLIAMLFFAVVTSEYIEDGDMFGLVVTVVAPLVSLYLLIYLIIVRRDKLEIRGENLTFKGGFNRLIDFTRDDIEHVTWSEEVSGGQYWFDTPARIIIELLDGKRIGFCGKQDGFDALKSHFIAYIPNRFIRIIHGVPLGDGRTDKHDELIRKIIELENPDIDFEGADNRAVFRKYDSDGRLMKMSLRRLNRLYKAKAKH